MTDQNNSSDINKTQMDKTAVLNFFYEMLTSVILPNQESIAPEIKDHPDFKKLYDQIVDLRMIAEILNNGDLSNFISNSGYIFSRLYNLQANLRHLTWQVKQIAAGDYTQKVDFMGEFSNSFNLMTRQLFENSQQLYKLANCDALTNVANRKSIDVFLAREFLLAKEKGHSLSVIMFDVDYFKKINDDYGHLVGDKVLTTVVAVIDEQFRGSDLFARYGGDEFLAVLPYVDASCAYKIVQRVFEAVPRATVKVGEDKYISITISAGISELRLDDKNGEDIVRRSDNALYKAKKAGRNRIHVD